MGTNVISQQGLWWWITAVLTSGPLQSFLVLRHLALPQALGLGLCCAPSSLGLRLRAFAAGALLGSPHTAPDQGSPFETSSLRCRASRRVLCFLTFAPISRAINLSSGLGSTGRRTFACHPKVAPPAVAPRRFVFSSEYPKARQSGA